MTSVNAVKHFLQSENFPVLTPEFWPDAIFAFVAQHTGAGTQHFLLPSAKTVTAPPSSAGGFSGSVTPQTPGSATGTPKATFINVPKTPLEDDGDGTMLRRRRSFTGTESSAPISRRASYRLSPERTPKGEALVDIIGGAQSLGNSMNLGNSLNLGNVSTTTQDMNASTTSTSGGGHNRISKRTNKRSSPTVGNNTSSSSATAESGAVVRTSSGSHNSSSKKQNRKRLLSDDDDDDRTAEQKSAAESEKDRRQLLKQLQHTIVLNLCNGAIEAAYLRSLGAEGMELSQDTEEEQQAARRDPGRVDRCNKLLRPFRAQYGTALRKLANSIFRPVRDDIELEKFASDQNGAAVMQWAYLPYDYGQDEDLVLNTWSVLQECVEAAPQGVAVPKELVSFDYAAHQTRDCVAALMYQHVDKPWMFLHAALEDATRPALDILLSLVVDGGGGDDLDSGGDAGSGAGAGAGGGGGGGGDDDTAAAATKMMTSSEKKNEEHRQHVRFVVRIDRILSRHKPPTMVATTVDNDSNLGGADNIPGSPQRMVTGRASGGMTSPSAAPLAATKYVVAGGDASSNNNSTDVVSKEDAAIIGRCLTKCTEGPINASDHVVEAKCVPPPSIGPQQRNGTTTTTATATPGTSMDCYEVRHERLPFTLVVFKDPSLGFHFRSTTLMEDLTSTTSTACVLQ